MDIRSTVGQVTVGRGGCRFVNALAADFELLTTWSSTLPAASDRGHQTSATVSFRLDSSLARRMRWVR